MKKRKKKEIENWIFLLWHLSVIKNKPLIIHMFKSYRLVWAAQHCLYFITLVQTVFKMAPHYKYHKKGVYSSARIRLCINSSTLEWSMNHSISLRWAKRSGDLTRADKLRRAAGSNFTIISRHYFVSTWYNSQTISTVLQTNDIIVSYKSKLVAVHSDLYIFFFQTENGKKLNTYKDKYLDV